MNKNILTCSAKILISKLLFTIAFLSLTGLQGRLEADQNNTAFIVADGNLEAPFYTLTFESNGSVVNFQTYPLRKGNTYFFKGGNISASHPFNIGSSYNVSSSHAVGGPLDQNSGANGQSITVTIPNDFQGTLAYYCTIHNTMIRQFTLAEPSPGGGEPQGLPVFALDASIATVLAPDAPGVEGNYTFEFGIDPATDIAFQEMVAVEEVGGQWQRKIDPATQFPIAYPLHADFPDLNSVKTYLSSQGITDANALGYISDGDAGGDAPVVYFLNSANLLALTGSESAPEGNYSIVEETDEVGTTYLTTKPMELVGGTWQEDVNGIPYPLDPAYGTMAQVDSYLADNNIQPVDQNEGGSGEEPHGLPVFALDTVQAQALSATAPGAGNYTFEFGTDPGTGSAFAEMVAAEEVGGEWQRTTEPGTSMPLIYPLESIYPDMDSVNTYLAGQGITDANALGYISDGDAGGDAPVVYFLNSANLLALTGSESAPEGNYSIVEETDEVGTTYLTTKPMELVGGTWQEDVNGIPYPLDPAYGTMAQVDSYLADNNIQPVDQNEGGSGEEPHGLPVFALDTVQAQALSATAPGAGNYTFEFGTDPGTGSAFAEMVAAEEVGGEWQRTTEPGTSMPLIYPLESIYPDMDSVNTYLAGQGITDANALGYISDGDAGGDGPVVYFLNSANLFALTGSESAPEGNYSIVEEDDGQGGTYLTALPMQLNNGIWQEDSQGIPYPLDSQAFPVMQDVDAFLQSQNLYPVNGPQGHPVYDLNTTQVTYLTNDAVNQAGHYAVVDVNQSHADLEPVQQDGNGSWIVTPADDYVNLVPSRFSDINATKAWFDANASAPVAFLPFDNNHSQPGDHNQSNPGSNPNDQNVNANLNDSNFQDAIDMWFTDEANATNTYGHIKDWNVSAVTDMSSAFKDRASFNVDISNWDVSSVTNMGSMFRNAYTFDQPIGEWNVSAVTNMGSMFRTASNFNQPIGDWDTGNVTNMAMMFSGAALFNQPIGSWDTSQVANMKEMFRTASNFNQPIGIWDVSSVTNMLSMFQIALDFNQPLHTWDTSNVINMESMFSGASDFNQPLNDWNVSSVTKMRSMFKTTNTFNNSLGDWDVSNVTTFVDMFSDANGLSEINKGEIHSNFKSNTSWTIDWSAHVQSSSLTDSNLHAVFDFNSSHLFQLTGSESAPEGNYSIVEEDDGQGGTYLTALPMQFNNDQWQEDPQGIPYPLDSQTFPVMQDVDVYLLSQNLYPVNEPQGHPIYDLNTSQVTNLTNGAANQAGHYAVVDVNESFVDLEPVQQDGNGTWIITPADDYVNLVPSHFSDINATKVWFDANASAPVAYLPFDNNQSQPGDHNQTNPGSGPNDHNTSGHLAVFDLNSSHLYQLTGSESAPEGNYSIVEQDDGQGGTYLTALPMQLNNGIWQEDSQGIPYPLDSQAFPVMQDVDAYLQSQNLHPVDEPQGHPIYDLNTTQVTNLTNGAANLAGHYAVVDVNQSHADLEPVQQDGNGTWIITPADDYVNLVPSHFSDINATKVWFDANASAPVAYLPFDNNHSQPGDHNGTDLGGDYNGTDPDTGGDHNGTQGLPVFALTMNQAETLIDGHAPAGSYAVEIFTDYQTGIEQRLLVSAIQIDGEWEREFDAIGNPVESPISSAHYPTSEAIYQYIDQQNLESIGYIIEQHDHNSTDPGGHTGDQNDTSPSTGDDYNGTQGLPVFALTMNQAETLIDGYGAAGSYAVEIFTDYQTGIEQRLIVNAIQIDGKWEREFDAIGNPVESPISSAHFPTAEAIYQYIDQQNLEPVGYIIEQHDHNATDPGGDYNSTDPSTGGDYNGTQGLPVFALTMNQAETLMDGYAPAGSYAVEVFMDYQTGIEQRLLVGAVQLDGEWEREFDAIGNPVLMPISSADFPNSVAIFQYIEGQYLQPIGYIVEQLDDNGTNSGGDHIDYNSSEPQESPTNRPLLTTLSNPTIENSQLKLKGIILSDGNNDDLVIGFQVSDSIFFNQTEEIIAQGNFAEGDVFEVTFDFSHVASNRIYFRAFARNSLFESFGSKKRAKIPEIETIPEFILFPDAVNLEDGWKENWLGVFHEYSNGWMYHLDLGWCFASPDNLGNVWLWINDHGWVWTNDSTWPHLYRNQTSSWLYLLIRQSGPAVFFDQMNGSFMHLNK